jgi:hypothetical protein
MKKEEAGKLHGKKILFSPNTALMIKWVMAIWAGRIAGKDHQKDFQKNSRKSSAIETTWES